MNTASKESEKPMKIAKLHVSGARAAVYGLQKIPMGVVGAEIELSFGNDWAGLTKTAVFRGVATKDVIVTGNRITIPAACVAKPGYRLQVGLYGVRDETMVIPTIWADLGAIQDAADPSGDTSTDPALPIWAQLQDQLNALKGEQGKSAYQYAVEGGYTGTEEEFARMLASGITGSSVRTGDVHVHLLADNWIETGEDQYRQEVEVYGLPEGYDLTNCQVDLTPSAEVLAVLYEKNAMMVAENYDGVVIVKLIGQKLANDYEVQVTVTEVVT